MKRYSPIVLEATANALATAYWYKDDLRDFLQRVGVPRSFLDTLDWTGMYKRAIVNKLLTRLSTAPKGQGYITSIIDGLIEQDETFPHLRRLREDGAVKADTARGAQRELKQLLGRQGTAEQARRARDATKAEAERQADRARQREDLVRDLNQKLGELASMEDPRKRGREFEKLLRSLFAVYDLDPRGSFSLPGEQIDGSIRLDNSTILVEARWEKEKSSPSQIRDFRAKVHDKLETTLGLYISMAGFTDEAVTKAADGGRRLLILMDGIDLAPVFQGLTDLVQLLRDKKRHTAETGKALYRATSA